MFLHFSDNFHSTQDQQPFREDQTVSCFCFFAKFNFPILFLCLSFPFLFGLSSLSRFPPTFVFSRASVRISSFFQFSTSYISPSVFRVSLSLSFFAFSLSFSLLHSKFSPNFAKTFFLAERGWLMHYRSMTSNRKTDRKSERNKERHVVNRKSRERKKGRQTEIQADVLSNFLQI
jgi:hypothetical protein